jgi:Divergent InlB B-repeat domain/Fibronectin type III domain
MFDRRWLLGLALTLATLFGAAHSVSAGVLDASWTAPTTNSDGSALTDLGSYKVYYSTSATPCPGSTFFAVATSTSAPPSNQLVSFRLKGLTTGATYNVAVTAVDAGGNESSCSAVASAVAQVDIAVTPPGTTNFGNVTVGSSATQNFPVQSARSGTITGTASVSAPFSIVSGSPFTLVGTGATATVTIRFAPTSAAAVSTNVNFTADGDTLSRPVTGTGVSTGSTLTVTKAGTGGGTVTSSPAGINCGTTCSASFTNGAAVTLTAAAATGSTFAGWSGGGCTGTGTCTVTVGAATSVTATFTRPSVTLSVTKTGNGSGTVTSSPAGVNCGATCSATFTSGTALTLTAAPAVGSMFSGWSGGGCSGTGSCTVTVNAATSVTATFALQGFALTVTKSGTGSGTVTSTPAGINCGATCSASFTNGTTVNLTAAPAAGATFTGWNGSCTGTGACSVTMSTARAVTATFTVSPVSFTDNPLVAGTTVMKPVHINELRTAIGAARTRNGLAAFAFTDPTLTAGVTIKAVHILELRTALNQVYTRLARTLPTYTDPTIVVGRTMPKAAHVQELRNAVSALP